MSRRMFKSFSEKSVQSMMLDISPADPLRFLLGFREDDGSELILDERDFDIVYLAVSTHGLALRYAAPELQDCEEIVKIITKRKMYDKRKRSE